MYTHAYWCISSIEDTSIKVLVCTSISPFVVLSHGPESAKLSHCINRLWHSKFIKSSKNGIFSHLIAHLRQIKLIDDIERRKIANIKYVALENWNDSFMFVASGLKKNLQGFVCLTCNFRSGAIATEMIDMDIQFVLIWVGLTLYVMWPMIDTIQLYFGYYVIFWWVWTHSLARHHSSEYFVIPQIIV